MQWHWLRALGVCEGRSVTVYEEVHPITQLGSLAVRKRFMERLACVLPAGAKAPIALTDAGFRNPWFRLVAAHGWAWLGRCATRITCQDYVRSTDAATTQCGTCKALQDKALFAQVATTGWGQLHAAACNLA